MKPFKKIVVIGATSLIAKSCVRLWVQQGCQSLVLVGRHAEQLQQLQVDLQTQSTELVTEGLVADFLDPALIQQTVDNIMQAGPVDLVLIAHGMMPPQADCQSDLALCRDTLAVTGISPALYAEAFSEHLEKQGEGTLAVIGSPAGDRGRRALYVYGAAKALLAHYVAGLQHRFASTKVKVIFIKPGPTATPMTAHLNRSFASAESVAQQIVSGIACGKSVIYAPRHWQLIMWVVRHIPSAIFNRLNL